MAISNLATYTQTNLDTLVQVSTANTNRDGTGTLSAAVLVGANGGFVDYVLFTATVTTAAGRLGIFRWDGTNARLIGEVLTSGVTLSSGTVAAETHVWVPPGGVPYKLGANNGLKFSTNNAETWNCDVKGENY